MGVNQQQAVAALDSAFADEVQQLFSYSMHRPDLDGEEAIERLGIDMAHLIRARSIAERLIEEASGADDQRKENAQ